MGPDGQLLTRTRQALDLWEARAGEPTSNLLGTGAVRCFEQRMAELLGRNLGLAMPSATLALRTALAAAGVRPGTEVLVPAYDWVATAAATRSLGAVPIAVDVELPGCGMDPARLAVELGRRVPAAVVVSHLFGVPADIPRIADLCNRHEVPVIEDCSQALGARVDGLAVGSFSTYAVCSVGPGKLVDAGDGGVLVADSVDTWTRALKASQHPTRQLLAGVGTPTFDTLALRLHPLAAVLALAELEGLQAKLARRRAHLDQVGETMQQAGVTTATAGRAVVSSGLAVPVLIRPELDRLCESSLLTRLPPGQHVIEEPLARPGDPLDHARRASAAVTLVAAAYPPDGGWST